MGSELHKITQFADPAMYALTGGKNDLAHDALTPTPAKPNAPFNPNAAPGTQLAPNPTGAPPGGMFAPNAGAAPAGYAPNPWQAATFGPRGTPAARIGTAAPGGQVAPNASGPGTVLQPGRSMPINAFRGGTPPIGTPPAMMTGNQGMPPSGPANPQLQQQLAIAQMLRGPQIRQ